MVIFIANYLNPTIKSQKVFYIKNQTDQCEHTKVVYITYTMASQDLPDIYALTMV